MHQPNDHAIVVGIDRYHQDIPRLHGCANDARLFRDWLVAADGGGLDPAHVHLITEPDRPDGAPLPNEEAPWSGRPVRTQIENIIVDYFDHLIKTGERRGRRLYLYFAGHGVAPKTLHAGEGETGVLMGDAVKLALRALLSRATADHVRNAALFDEVVLFVDCCREINRNAMASFELPDFVADPEVVTRIPYLYFMATKWAKKTTERSLPHPLDPAQGDLWQGIFTHCLIRGLRSAVGDDGMVTSKSLAPFVRSAVQKLLPPEDNLRPQYFLDIDLPDIVFGPGSRVQLVVAAVRQDGSRISQVVVHDGLGLDVIGDESGAANEEFRFALAPARYLVVAKDAAGAVIAQRLVELFGSPVHVVF